MKRIIVSNLLFLSLFLFNYVVGIAPSLYATQRQLKFTVTADSLDHKLENRPTRASLEASNIVRGMIFYLFSKYSAFLSLLSYHIISYHIILFVLFSYLVTLPRSADNKFMTVPIVMLFNKFDVFEKNFESKKIDLKTGFDNFKVEII